MALRGAFASLLAAALALGCSAATPRTPPAAAPSPRQEGDAAWSRGEYAVALAKYREALRAAPHDLTLRFTVTRTLVTLLTAKLVSGCGGHPTPPALAQTPAALEASSRREGDAALSRGDYAAAVAEYREALRVTPDDLKLRFALGSALSHLDRRDEAIEQFRWVVEHRGPEVAMAREWLVAVERVSNAGASHGRQGVTVSSVPGAEGLPAPAGVGSIKGATVWPGVSPDAQTVALELRFNGDDASTKGHSVRLHIGLGRPYRMSDLPAGAYRVVGRSAGVKLWETRAVVGAGKETVLDLTGANSLVTPKEFLPRGGG
jgi:tetratricopeptide repeat protein